MVSSASTGTSVCRCQCPCSHNRDFWLVHDLAQALSGLPLNCPFFCRYPYSTLTGDPGLAPCCEPVTQLDELKFPKEGFRTDFSTWENSSACCCLLPHALRVAVLQGCPCRTPPLAALTPQARVPARTSRGAHRQPGTLRCPALRHFPLGRGERAPRPFGGRHALGH